MRVADASFGARRATVPIEVRHTHRDGTIAAAKAVVSFLPSISYRHFYLSYTGHARKRMALYHISVYGNLWMIPVYQTYRIFCTTCLMNFY